MSKKLNNEVKTGIMIVFCILILIGVLFRMGAFDFNRQGYNISVLFNFANGIEKNAPVMLAGVEVGKVEGISIQYGDETKVALELWVDSGAKLREDSEVYISTLGLMGEKYIEITPGSRGAAFLEAGNTIVGQDPMRMEKLMAKGEAIADNLDKTLVDVRRLVSNVDDVVVTNRDEIDGIITNLESTAKNFEEFSSDIKAHPWKLISKPKKERRKKNKDEDRRNSR